MVRGHHSAAVPIASLDGNLVAKRLFQLVDGGGRKAAKFNCRPIGADRLDADRLLFGKNPGKAVEVRQTPMIVIGVALAFDRLAGFVADKFERAGAENVLLVPA